MTVRDMLERTIVIVCLSLGGCATAVEFKPDPATLESIPPDMARAQLKELLARAHPHPARHRELVKPLEVGEDSFSFEAQATGWIEPEWRTFSFRYDQLDVHAYQNAMDDGKGLVVKLNGRLGTAGLPGSAMNPAGPEDGCLTLATREDGEMFIEALLSLKAAATGTAPHR